MLLWAWAPRLGSSPGTTRLPHPPGLWLLLFLTDRPQPLVQAAQAAPAKGARKGEWEELFIFSSAKCSLGVKPGSVGARLLNPVNAPERATGLGESNTSKVCQERTDGHADRLQPQGGKPSTPGPPSLHTLPHPQGKHNSLGLEASPTPTPAYTPPTTPPRYDHWSQHKLRKPLPKKTGDLRGGEGPGLFRAACTGI